MKNPPAPTRLEIRYGDLDPYGHVNNAVYLEFFEKIRIDYWRAVADLAGIDELEAGDVPGARYVIAETTIRFKTAIFFEDTLHGAARMRTVGNRSYTMDFELRTGKTFRRAARSSRRAQPPTSSSTPYKTPSKPRPDWFLPTVAKLEGRPEETFFPEGR